MNGLAVDVCMYTSRPAGYKIRGIDTGGENTTMLLWPKRRGEGMGSESDRKRRDEGLGECQTEIVRIDPRYACN